MTHTIAAVLARFDGDAHAAVVYCANMSNDYPHLTQEYDGIAKAIIEQEETCKRST